eukprot:TRINITY_DN1503_c0_g1_i1.p1 TRINITY_DN1503_c0_g1~~TRINITY_DN1503_c0_g1_i1.p1  ORF type:complete len:261 (-),score=114.71 TRINITY_DN1503_c0_g1_i1:129-872(-)
MAGVGTGYDLSATTYSPDGRIFQVEYAHKAVENSGTSIAVRVKDGIIFGVEKLIVSKMLVEGSNKRIQPIDLHAGMAVAGLVADSRQIVNKARTEAQEYESFYRHKIPIKILSERVSGFVQMYTLYSHVRPFGTTAILGGYDDNGPQLYMIKPSGISWGYYGCAAGKGKTAAKTELEKLKLADMTCRQALVEVARIIHLVHDDVKDKDFELEMGWICTESNNLFQSVPANLRDEAEAAAKQILEDAE